MTWQEMNENRKANRKHPSWKVGHAKRQGSFVLLEKTSGEIVAQAWNGCFGRLKELPNTREEYDRWALGTQGAF